MRFLITIIGLSLGISYGETVPAAPSPVTTPSATAPASIAEAQMQVEKFKQEISQEEKLWAEETTREKEAEVRRSKRFSDFNQDKIKLQQAIAEKEEKLKEVLAKMESHQLKEKELHARFLQISQTLIVKTKELRSALALGIPYRLDKRNEALNLLVRDLEGDGISTEEGFNRLWAIEQNERRLAQEAEVYSGDFADGAGDPIQVKYLRVGKQLLVFSSLDGTKLGILKPLAPAATGYIWIREKEMDRATRLALKEAIATAEGKALPGFVPMPIWKSTFPALASSQVDVESSESMKVSVP